MQTGKVLVVTVEGVQNLKYPNNYFELYPLLRFSFRSQII